MMAELYMARTCKWGILRVVGGDVWNHSGDVLITPANNRLSGREGLDAQIHAKAGEELTQVTRNICLEMRKIKTKHGELYSQKHTKTCLLRSQNWTM